VKSFFLNSTLALCSVLVSLVLVEACLQWFWNPVPARVDSRTMTGMALPGWPDFLRFVPGTHTTAVSPTAEFSVRYEINELGMRDIERSRNERGKPRILVIGDSFTEGYGVEGHETYPAILAGLEPRDAEYINAGMRGMSPSFAYFRLLRLFDTGLDFDFVLLQLFDNDFADDALYRKKFNVRPGHGTHCLVRDPFQESHGMLRPFGPTAWPLSHLRLSWLYASVFSDLPTEGPVSHIYPSRLASQILEIYSSERVNVIARKKGNESTELMLPMMSSVTLNAESLDRLWALLRDYNLRESSVERRAGKSTKRYEKERTVTLTYLDCVLHLLEARDIPLFVYYQASLPLTSRADEKAFGEWCRENAVPFLSLRAELLEASTASDKALFYPIDGHLTPAGHDFIAQRMHGWLSQELPRLH
jgi:lysophospholipase L1-like esterase